MKRLPRLDLKRFSLEVTRDQWLRAKRYCRIGNATKTIGDVTVKSTGTATNCVIADALVEFLGAETPTRRMSSWNDTTKKYEKVPYIDVMVSADTARAGKNAYDHNGSDLVEAFDSGKRPSKLGLEFPIKVNFKRTN